jgi:hypothetical protein
MLCSYYITSEYHAIYKSLSRKKQVSIIMAFHFSSILLLSLINIIMFLNTAVGEIFNTTTQMIKNNTIPNNSNEQIFQWRTPINYTLEDMLMSLSLLVMLIIFFIIWYLLTRLFMYLAYHKTAEKIRQIEDSGNDVSFI